MMLNLESHLTSANFFCVQLVQRLLCDLAHGRELLKCRDVNDASITKGTLCFKTRFDTVSQTQLPLPAIGEVV
jgi:hypothetical protein